MTAPSRVSEISSSSSSARNVTIHNQLLPHISDTSVTTTVGFILSYYILDERIISFLSSKSHDTSSSAVTMALCSKYPSDARITNSLSI